MIDATAGYFCPKHYVKLEKQYILEYILCGSIYMKFKYRPDWASLVAQWLRVCLPMQGTRVRALVWEDPTCRGATGPVCHNY